LFGCTPAEAENQDFTLVKSIMEYRDAREVLRIEKDGSDQELKFLAEHPGMAASLKVLQDTQVILYENPALMKAVEAVRTAQTEQ
jgi:hypothetical protein